MTARGFLTNLKDEASRVGYSRALQRSLYSVANKHVEIRQIAWIYLTRDFLRPLDPNRYTRHRSAIASERQLLEMRDEGKWDISAELLDGFHQGDDCLLSFVDDQLGGYTWVHSRGRPEIIPGLRVRIPKDYVYNYAGFTLPEFRGFGLQAYRHHEVLNQPQWAAKRGMIGYVECVNWSSQKGQSKSGYRKLDDMTLIGHDGRLIAIVPAPLKRFGIRRLNA